MKMSLDAFRQKADRLPADAAECLRKQFICTFIDTESDYYRKYIETVKDCSDGWCYSGYLWDCFIAPIVIRPDDVINHRDRLRKVFAFWDIHSRDKIWVDDFWKFGKDTILRLDFDDLLDNPDYLPEDIYIFDESMQWTLALTHEYTNGTRYCVKTGNL